MEGQRPQRFGYIDSLRAIAALSVLVAHMASELFERFPSLLSTLEYDVAFFFRTYFDPGKFGVTMFFCISGFLIPNSLSSTRSNPVLWFVTTRIFRLYPAYWLSIAAALCLLSFPPPVLSGPLILANITMLQQFFGFENLQGVYWTLQIEIIFYGLCVVLFSAGVLHRPRAIFLISVGLVLLAVAMAAVRYLSGAKWPVALPLALALMYWSYNWRLYLFDKDAAARRFSLLFLGVFAVALPPICLLAYSFDEGFGETWYRYLATYSGSLLFFIIFTRYRHINSRWLQFIGIVSYSLYLLGSMLIPVVLTHVFPYMTQVPAFASIIVCTLGAVAISAVSYVLVEKPSIRLGAAINRRRTAIGAL